jgi:PmbA protein
MLAVDEARRMAAALVERAISAGADAADALYAGDSSTSVQVRLGELEHVNRSESEEVGLRVFVGSRSATVASSDFSEEALKILVERAAAMAAEAPEDPYAGLAPDELLHRGPLPDLDAVDGTEADPAQLKERALAAESAALAVPGIANSSGGSASTSSSTVALATSAGFAEAYRVTGHGCSVSVVAGEGGGMQRDHAWHGTRHLADLDSPEAVGRLAGERAAARLNPVKPKDGRMPVIFDARVASSLLGHFSGAISGSSVARKSSFLQDKLGQRVFAPEVSIVDDPLRRRGSRSRPFDGEGLRVARRELVADGVLTGWLAESASARQLGIQPTGNASRGTGGSPGAGTSNFYIAAGKRSREELLAAFPEALLVVELIGHGVNGVTGDYSRGAAGFLVRGGALAEPVSGITIAANLLDMFATLEPGSDLEFRRGTDAPTILISEMTIAAS